MTDKEDTSEWTEKEHMSGVMKKEILDRAESILLRRMAENELLVAQFFNKYPNADPAQLEVVGHWVERGQFQFVIGLRYNGDLEAAK